MMQGAIEPSSAKGATSSPTTAGRISPLSKPTSRSTSPPASPQQLLQPRRPEEGEQFVYYRASYREDRTPPAKIQEFHAVWRGDRWLIYEDHVEPAWQQALSSSRRPDFPQEILRGTEFCPSREWAVERMVQLLKGRLKRLSEQQRELERTLAQFAIEAYAARRLKDV